jgi:hypothetical protein
MTYNKPEIVVLGNASVLIEKCGKGGCFGDGTVDELPSISAYELDE